MTALCWIVSIERVFPAHYCATIASLVYFGGQDTLAPVGAEGLGFAMAELARSSSLTDRMMRAARLEVPLYEEVEADITATNQALTVVVLVAVASAIGQGLKAGSTGLVGGVVFGLVLALIGWAVWSYALYFVGTRFFGGTATYGELLRTIGFADSPGVLQILVFIPVLGGLIAFVAGVWTLVASFIGARQALDFDNSKTFLTMLVAFIALLIVWGICLAILGTIFGLGVLVGSALP
jgi:hypothetical protein